MSLGGATVTGVSNVVEGRMDPSPSQCGDPIVIVETYQVAVVTTESGSVGTGMSDVLATHDISALVGSDDELNRTTTLKLTVVLTDAEYRPAMFEYKQTNTANGFSVMFRSEHTATGDWREGVNHLEVSASEFRYVGNSGLVWSNMSRVELYLNARNEDQPSASVTCTNVRLELCPATVHIGTITCRPSGRFSNFTCVPQQCAPTQVPYSDKAVPGSLRGATGDVVNVTCTAGFQGSAAAVCLSTGVFANVTTCVADHCTPTQVKHSDRSANGTINGVMGSEMVVQCDAGYNGSGTTRCGDSGWKLLFRQTAPAARNKTGWQLLNEHRNDAADFSVLSLLDNSVRGDDGKYLFKIIWPQRPGRNYNVWKQTTNPILPTAGGVSGYEALDIQFDNFGWGGLQYNIRNGSLLTGSASGTADGTTNGTASWYAVGSAESDGGIPAAGTMESCTELYVYYGDVVTFAPINRGVLCTDQSEYVMYSAESVHQRFSGRAIEGLNRVRELATGAPTSQSSIVHEGVSGRAVDGIKGGFYFGETGGTGSCTHTGDHPPDAWWQVDLGATFAIHTVNIYHRTDRFQDRLNTARIVVSATADYHDHGSLCFRSISPNSTGRVSDPDSGSCDGAIGQFLTVDRSYRGQIITLCHVEIYGVAAAAPPHPNSADHWICASSRSAQWKYDSGNYLFDFVPRLTDLLVAGSVQDNLTMLHREHTQVAFEFVGSPPIRKGYKKGDVRVTAKAQDELGDWAGFDIHGSVFGQERSELSCTDCLARRFQKTFTTVACLANPCYNTEFPHSNRSTAGSVNGSTDDRIYVGCDPGYSPSGYSQCWSNRSFSAISCDPVSCVETQVPHSDKATPLSITGVTLDIVNVSCDEGFMTPSGSDRASFQCQPDNYFNCEGSSTYMTTYGMSLRQAVEACIANHCLATFCANTSVPYSDHETERSVGAVIHSSVNITCNLGYNGSGAKACYSNGSWSDVTCHPKSCSSARVPHSDRAASGSIVGKTMDTVTVTCDAGRRGSGTVLCRQNGTFSHSLISCEEVDCPANSIGSLPAGSIGCACLPGFAGVINATKVEPYFEGACIAEPCPANSFGVDVPTGCTCHALYSGAIRRIQGHDVCTVIQSAPNETNSSTGNHNSSNSSDASTLSDASSHMIQNLHCVRNVGPHHAGECAVFPCPAGSYGPSIAAGCQCQPGFLGGIIATDVFPYRNGSCVPSWCAAAGSMDGLVNVRGCSAGGAWGVAECIVGCEAGSIVSALANGICAADYGSGMASYKGQFAACYPCPAGRHAEQGWPDCLDCQAGRYQSEVASSSCRLCPNDSGPGSVSSKPGAVALEACKCEPGHGGILCTACLPGFFKATNGPSECLACPSHSTTGPCTKSKTCQCDPGYAVNILNATDGCHEYPVDCVGGWTECTQMCVKIYQVVTGAHAGGHDCIAGHLTVAQCYPGEGLCPAGPEIIGCAYCQAGQFDADDSAFSRCEPCPSGHFATGANATGCARHFCEPQCLLNVEEDEVRRFEYATRVVKIYMDLGCDGQPGSDAVMDSCRVCAGDNATCMDCEGQPYGPAMLDACGTCNEDTADDCLADCAGIWGGSASVDGCGICSDGNRTTTCPSSAFRLSVSASCPADSSETDALRQAIATEYNIPASSVQLQCGAARRRLQFGELVIDLLLASDNASINITALQNVAGLESTTTVSSAATFDCLGNIVAADSVYPTIDTCGVCGGNGTSCSDCALIPHGLNQADACGVCDKNISNDCTLDCTGVWGGDTLVDACAVCNGGNDCILCQAGMEKCAPHPECLTGCRRCLQGFHSLPGESCTRCPDGQTTDELQASCVACSTGHAGRRGRCETCSAAMEPTADALRCVRCKEGRYKGVGFAQCQYCSAGSEPTADQNDCQPCSLGYRATALETGGACQPCGVGQQPTDERSVAVLSGASKCSECPVGQYSDFDPLLAVSHRCLSCPEEGMTTMKTGCADVHACVCPAGTYNSEKVGVLRGHPFNYGDSMAEALMKSSLRDIVSGRRCVRCSHKDLMTCLTDSHGVAGLDPVIAAGYAEMRHDFGAHNGTRQLFKCSFGKNVCQQTHLGLLDGLNVSASNCSEGYHGVLCSDCEESFAWTPTGCVRCDGSDGLRVAAFMVSAVVITVAVVWKLVSCRSTRMQSLVLWAGVLQRIWPRLSQTGAIFVANYQIVSYLSDITGLSLPEPFQSICAAIGSVVNCAFESLPSVACLIGGGFGRRLLVKIMTPLFLLVVIGIVHRCRIYHLLTHTMPFDKTIKNWRVKLARALSRSQILHSSSSWAFACVYLLYPSTTSAILETFFCRAVTADGIRLLMADSRIQCYDGAGTLDPVYVNYLISGCILTMVWVVGVPLYFAARLYGNREVICHGNPDYALVSSLRPLFIFFKPDCYMFEVYFMVERLFLIGVLRAIRVYASGFTVTIFLSNFVALGMLCLVIHRRPSKTDAYNTANAFSHALLMFTNCAMMSLAFPNSQVWEDTWLTPIRVGIALALAQIPFWLYLIYVAFGNLRVWYQKSRKEAEHVAQTEQHLHERMLRARQGTLSVTVGEARCVPIIGAAAHVDGYFVSIKIAEQQLKKSFVCAAISHTGSFQTAEAAAKNGIRVNWPPALQQFREVHRSATIDISISLKRCVQ